MPEQTTRLVLADRRASADVAALLARCFPAGRAPGAAYLDWFYWANPEGDSIVCNAVEAGRVVAHAALTPMRARVGGAVERVVLINNVATDPAEQRRGVASALLRFGLERAAEEGFDRALVVPNAQSIGLFAGRLGFATHGRLDARIGLGPAPEPTLAPRLGFERIWTRDVLRWRLQRPGARYRVVRRRGRLCVEARTGWAGIRVELASLPDACESELEADVRPRAVASLAPWLFIGLDPRRRFAGRVALDLPLALRPAPLHLASLALRGAPGALRRDDMLLEGLSLDAF